MTNYGFIKEVDISFEDTIKKITEELKKEGFGILTKINLKEKFKEKMNYPGLKSGVSNRA